MDIIAENISDDADIRRRLRSLFTVAGVLQSRKYPRFPRESKPFRERLRFPESSSPARLLMH